MLDLSGSHYEVGLQYGVLLRPEIHDVYAAYCRLLDELTGGELRRAISKWSLSGKVDSMRASLPAGIEEELRGIADGCGSPFQTSFSSP